MNIEFQQDSMEHIIKQTKDLEATVASLTTGSGNTAHLLALLDQFKQAVAQSSGNKGSLRKETQVAKTWQTARPV